MLAKKNYIIKHVRLWSILGMMLIAHSVMSQNKSIHLKFNDAELTDYSIKDGKKLHFIDVYGNKVNKRIKIISDTSFVVLNFYLEVEDTLTISEISYIRNRTIARKHFKRSIYYTFIPFVGVFMSGYQFYMFLFAERYFPIETIKIDLVSTPTSD